MNITKKVTYNSPLRIMSHMTSTCPWRQTAKNIPAIANRANIFFRASGPAFFHRSTQVSRHLAKSSCSMTFSHAISSELRSSCPLRSGGCATPVGWAEVLWWEDEDDCWTGFWEGCGCYHNQWDSVIVDANSPSLLHLWKCPLPPEISSIGRPMNECRCELSLHRMHCWLAWENYSHPWPPRGWTWVEAHFLPCKDKEDTRSASPMSRCVQVLGWLLDQQLGESRDNNHMNCWADLPDRIGEEPANIN